GEDLRTLQQSVAELSGVVSGLNGKLDEIKQILRTLQQPVAAPPPVQQQPAGGETPKPASTGPSMLPGDLYLSARGDYQSARYDLALQSFNEFLKYYPTEKTAANSQFYIGMI